VFVQWQLPVGRQVVRHGQLQTGTYKRKIRSVALFSVKDFPSRGGQATRQNDSFGLVAYTQLC